MNWLLDMGAAQNIINWKDLQDLTANSCTPIRRCDAQLRAADGNNLIVHGETELDIQLGLEVFRITVIMAELGELQGILGMDFLSREGCVFDLYHGRMIVNESEFILHRLGDEPKCNVCLSKSVTVPPESELIVKAQLCGDTWDHSRELGTLEPTDTIVSTYGLMVPRALVNVDHNSVQCTLTNFGSMPVSVRKGTTIATLTPAESVISNIVRNKDTREHESNPVELAHLEEMVNTAAPHLTSDQLTKLWELVARKANTFFGPDGKLGRTQRIKHTIDNGNAKPIKLPPRRLSEAHQEIANREIDKMLEQGIIEPSDSPWASPIVLVKKKDNTIRFCIDYRNLNHLSRKDAYPLPNISDSLDALGGSQYFCTLDLASGYWQVEMDEKDKERTAFVSRRGLFQFTVVPFGLTNAPATFERLMELVLQGLQWDKCLLYTDDIIVFGADFEQTLSHLDEVLTRIEGAGLKLKPKKCHLFQQEVQFLGHVVTPAGICCDPEKISAVSDWQRPRNVREIRSFLGFASYYRCFIEHFAEKAAPLTQLTQKGQPFRWDDACEAAFANLKEALTNAPILTYPSRNPDDQFILDTDASDVGIGAVLSQVQGGVEQVAAYASKTLNKSQRNYCTTNKELLAVVTFVKQFRHYLLWRKFKIRTDHSSLCWLMNFKDAEGMVARWIVQLSCYDFDIEHRKGVNHGNADGLSRKEIKVRHKCRRDTCPQCPQKQANMVNVITRLKTAKANSTRQENSAQAEIPLPVETEESAGADESLNENQGSLNTNWLDGWDDEKIVSLQNSDPNINQVIQFMETGEKPDNAELSKHSLEVRELCAQWHYLEMIDNKLYRKWTPKNTGNLVYQLIAPKYLRLEAFKHLHESVTGGHLSIKQTVAAIRQRMFWPHCKSDVERWCAACDICAQIKAGPRFKAKLKQLPVGDINDRIAINVMGEFPETENGNKYIIVISEYFSKWVVAAATPDQTAQTVAEVLLNQYITIFGAPRQIHTDQGRNFESELIKTLSQLLGVNKTRTTPYRPQSDGLVERFNRTAQ